MLHFMYEIVARLNCTVKIIIIFVGINKRVRCFESPTFDSVCLNLFNGLKTGFCLWPQMRISFGFKRNLHFTIEILRTSFNGYNHMRIVSVFGALRTKSGANSALEKSRTHTHTRMPWDFACFPCVCRNVCRQRLKFIFI